MAVLSVVRWKSAVPGFKLSETKENLVNVRTSPVHLAQITSGTQLMPRRASGFVQQMSSAKKTRKFDAAQFFEA
jgi:hypothetical protein